MFVIEGIMGSYYNFFGNHLISLIGRYGIIAAFIQSHCPALLKNSHSVFMDDVRQAPYILQRVELGLVMETHRCFDGYGQRYVVFIGCFYPEA